MASTVNHLFFIPSAGRLLLILKKSIAYKCELFGIRVFDGNVWLWSDLIINILNAKGFLQFSLSEPRVIFYLFGFISLSKRIHHLISNRLDRLLRRVCKLNDVLLQLERQLSRVFQPFWWAFCSRLSLWQTWSQEDQQYLQDTHSQQFQLQSGHLQTTRRQKICRDWNESRCCVKGSLNSPVFFFATSWYWEISFSSSSWQSQIFFNQKYELLRATKRPLPLRGLAKGLVWRASCIHQDRRIKVHWNRDHLGRFVAPGTKCLFQFSGQFT